MAWVLDDHKDIGIDSPVEEKPSLLIPLLLMGIPFLIPLIKK